MVTAMLSPLLFLPTHILVTCLLFLFFFFNDTATTEIYTLSLHDALPIAQAWAHCRWMGALSGAVPSRQAASRRRSAPQPAASRSGDFCHAAVAASSLATVNRASSVFSQGWPAMRCCRSASTGAASTACAAKAASAGYCQSRAAASSVVCEGGQ